MRIKKPIAVSVIVLAALSAGGAALAAGHHRSVAPATAERTTAVDTDNVQEGDQTSPDGPSAVEDPSQEGSGESGSEGSNESDGPGGHEDPPGNIDHQFNGQE